MAGSSIARVVSRPVLVPLTPPLQSASGEVRDMPMLLVDIADADGAVGSAYILCYTREAQAGAAAFAIAVGESLAGAPAAPRAAAESLSRRVRLTGRDGLAATVLGGLDMALWDLAARRAGMPLARLLGADPQPLPAYASLRSSDPAAVAAEAEAAATTGFTAFKVKIGHGSIRDDLAAVAAVRSGAGAHAAVMVDYNQALTVPEAIHRAEHLADAGVAWIEEPVGADDPAGHARVAAASTVPVQLGENWQGPREAARNITAGACDLAMLDAMKIGGVTGWLCAAAIADAASLPVSTHLFCEISAQLLAATPGRHWLEWLDVAGPLLTEPLVPADGRVVAADRPGSGIDWDEAQVRRFAVD